MTGSNLGSKSDSQFFPNFKEELKLWKKKYVVIGVDEVGRGALAGPVVTGAVAYKKNCFNPQITKLPVKIDDSKRSTEKQREKACRWIKKNCLGWAVSEISASFINKYGIVKATNKSFRLTIKKLIAKLATSQKKYLLADAFYIKYIRGISLRNQKAIIKGDRKSITIASASIIAKVYRDRLMTRICRDKYIEYGWKENKGYGTKKHFKIIKKYGITRMHRKFFIRSFQALSLSTI